MMLIVMISILGGSGWSPEKWDVGWPVICQAQHAGLRCDVSHPQIL